MIVPKRNVALLVLMVGGCLVVGCDRGAPRRAAGPPNIILVIWDTVRAENLSLYGYQRRTTPQLEEWAREARVYDDCISAATTTVPSHWSIFTGLLPTEHRATNDRVSWKIQFRFLPEILQAAGYGTYLYSENPFVGERHGLARGFDEVDHPWEPKYVKRAFAIAKSKLDPLEKNSDWGDELRLAIRNGGGSVGVLNAAGELGKVGLMEWLSRRDSDRPFFACLNYMAAHKLLVPPREYREKFMTPEQVDASYQIDRTWSTEWAYMLRLRDIDEAEIELLRSTYDAALLQLDRLFAELLKELEGDGCLNNTIVVLTSDHGEHFGEHHLLDHQFSVYDELLRVPLVIHYPLRFEPGRSDAPVSNLDLFPTLLELAGIEQVAQSKAFSLLRTPTERVRMGEFWGTGMGSTLRKMSNQYPRFDPKPWRRVLRAYYDGPFKLIEASDGTHELYNLLDDPDESTNLIGVQPKVARRLLADVQAYVASLRQSEGTPPIRPAIDAKAKKMLELLGYAQSSDDALDDARNDPAGPPTATRPSSRPSGEDPSSP